MNFDGQEVEEDGGGAEGGGGTEVEDGMWPRSSC